MIDDNRWDTGGNAASVVPMTPMAGTSRNPAPSVPIAAPAVFAA